MKKRIIGAIIVVAILVTSIILGEIPFTLVVTVSAVFGLKELIDIKYEKENINLVKILSGLFLILFLLNNILYKINDKVLIILPILGLIIPIIFYNNKSKYNINDAFYFLGIIYFLAFAFGSIIEMRETSIYKCIYIFIISFMTDTYAYIGGMLIGKTKLTSISPKKTIEGSIIGTVMATIIGSCFYNIMINDIGAWSIILISLLLSIVSQLGDLFFSSIKRYFDINYYSNLIPGHGGIFDRLDSILFAALAFTFVVTLL